MAIKYSLDKLVHLWESQKLISQEAGKESKTLNAIKRSSIWTKKIRPSFQLKNIMMDLAITVGGDETDVSITEWMW